MHAALFPTGAAARLFSDSAVVRAMLLVEGTLARVQGQLGLIPEVSAAAIHRAAHEVQIDPGALAPSTGENGVSVPALVAAFRAEMNAPEHAQYVHWGATSQDIIDTGLMLRMRQWLALSEADLKTLLTRLADAAETHAATVITARTYGQAATPTTWGAVLAQWGNPLLDAAISVAALRDTSLWVSLSGAAGTSAVWGSATPALRAALATELKLQNPERSWHTDRGPLLRLSAWMAQVTAALGSVGQTTVALAASGTDEVGFENAGGSSTMPQKQNPVTASALSALALHASALHGGLAAAASHQHQRDGAAWFAEWLTLPQLCLTTSAALQRALRLTEQLQPDTEVMHRNVQTGLGLIYAEALTFALTEVMSRPDAQAKTKALCAQARATKTHLRDIVAQRFPNLSERVFDNDESLGRAPQAARAFALRVRAL